MAAAKLDETNVKVGSRMWNWAKGAQHSGRSWTATATPILRRL